MLNLFNAHNLRPLNNEWELGNLYELNFLNANNLRPLNMEKNLNSVYEKKLLRQIILGRE